MESNRFFRRDKKTDRDRHMESLKVRFGKKIKRVKGRISKRGRKIKINRFIMEELQEKDFRTCIFNRSACFFNAFSKKKFKRRQSSRTIPDYSCRKRSGQRLFRIKRPS